MNQSNEIGELAKALAQAQSEIMPAVKDSANPFFKSKYADLTSVWNACRAALTKHSLAVCQTTDEMNGRLMLITTLMHSSGQWIRSHMPILSSKPDAQSMGSAISYSRRYALAAIAGVTAEDDDGNAATRPQNASIVQRITKEQADELHTMFNKCPEGFRKYVLNKISTEMKIGTFFELPANCYDALRLSIEQNMTKQVEEQK